MMAKPTLLDDAVWKRVEEDRLLEERVREPYLVAFRATPEETELREAEDAQEAALPDEPFAHWAERIARAGREGVRFERYLTRQGFYPNIPKDDAPGWADWPTARLECIGDLVRYTEERRHPPANCTKAIRGFCYPYQ